VFIISSTIVASLLGLIIGIFSGKPKVIDIEM